MFCLGNILFFTFYCYFKINLLFWMFSFKILLFWYNFLQMPFEFWYYLSYSGNILLQLFFFCLLFIPFFFNCWSICKNAFDFVITKLFWLTAFQPMAAFIQGTFYFYIILFYFFLQKIIIF